MLAAEALHCRPQLQLKWTVQSRVQTAGWLRRKWSSSPEVNKHIGRPIYCPYHRRAWRPNERFPRRRPQPKSNFVHFSFKICCLVAAVSMIFMRINWPKFNFLKLILMTIISSCSLSSIKASATMCSFVLTTRLDHRSLDTHYWLLTLQLAHYVLWCELATVDNLQLYLRSFIVFHLLYSW